MIQPRQHLSFCLLLLAAIPGGCGWICFLNSPTIPEYRQPTEADIEQMSQRMMGKAPKREAPVSTDGVQVVFQTGHASGIRTLALSPNGRYFASSGQDATVKIWGVASGRKVRTPKAPRQNLFDSMSLVGDMEFHMGGGAGANHDQTITVSELQVYVIEQVRKLTEGGQNPTVRRENLEYEFVVY